MTDFYKSKYDKGCRVRRGEQRGVTETVSYDLDPSVGHLYVLWDDGSRQRVHASEVERDDAAMNNAIKAAPIEYVTSGAATCRNCGRGIKRVLGGQGRHWLHGDGYTICHPADVSQEIR